MSITNWCQLGVGNLHEHTQAPLSKAIRATDTSLTWITRGWEKDVNILSLFEEVWCLRRKVQQVSFQQNGNCWVSFGIQPGLMRVAQRKWEKEPTAWFQGKEENLICNKSQLSGAGLTPKALAAVSIWMPNGWRPVGQSTFGGRRNVAISSPNVWKYELKKDNWEKRNGNARVWETKGELICKEDTPFKMRVVV